MDENVVLPAIEIFVQNPQLEAEVAGESSLFMLDHSEVELPQISLGISVVTSTSPSSQVLVEDEKDFKFNTSLAISQSPSLIP
ncbi:hypothetical protein SUGI_0683950 [Cryptomeria japonica]|nr:hypothetical protein SUGI_0683950 [Cryptomeria japonica]